MTDGGLISELTEIPARFVLTRGVAACSQTFHLHKREFSIRRRLSGLDLQVVLDSLQDGIRSASTEHTRRRCAKLNKVGRHGFPVVHGVEGGDLVHPHPRHLQHLGHMIHHADRRPSLVLSLSKVEKRDDSGLFVLRRVTRDDFVGEFAVLLVEGEWNFGVVVVGITVHKDGI